MLTAYLPVLFFIGIGLLVGTLPLAIGYFLRPSKPSVSKLSPYECGFRPFENARVPFEVRYYRIAILFILFDVETAFLFPWAVALRKIGWQGFTSMIIFLGLLIVGFIYEWLTGALEWR